MKIYDCFTFFNETDLLAFRLQFLSENVDQFIIIESNLTHSGKPKPYYYLAEEERFKPWEHKIKYFPIEQSCEGLVFGENEEKYNPSNGSWILENEQRNAVSKYLTDVDADDLIIISDLDEIPDPEILKKINTSKGPQALSMLFHYYYLNCQCVGTERWWRGSIVLNGKDFLEHTPQRLRDKRNDYPAIPKAGWHFSFLGGIEKIRYKIQSFAHTEYNKDYFLNEAALQEAVAGGKDIFGRKDKHYKTYPIDYYPLAIQKIAAGFPAFVAPVKKPGFLSRIYYQLKNMFSI